MIKYLNINMPTNNINNKIYNAFKEFFDEHNTYSKKTLVEFAKKIYEENSKSLKKKDENVEKKPLNAYQLFMKEQRVILNKRENERTDGQKKTSKELMCEIAELWKVQKTNNNPVIENSIKPKIEAFEEEQIENIVVKDLKLSNSDEDDISTEICEKKKTKKITKDVVSSSSPKETGKWKKL